MKDVLQGRRLFYFCYDHDKPTGGQKDTYRHVDVSVEAGVEAYVLHQDAARRLTWFANETPVIGLSQFQEIHRPSTDIVVVPEDLGPGMFEIEGPKVIFNKNLYYGFQWFGEPPFDGRDPYADRDVIGAMVVSEHNLLHLRYAYPQLPIAVVTCGVSSATFSYRPVREKRRGVAVSAKVPGHVLTLYHMLRARAAAGLNDFGDVEWRTLRGLTEAEVASTLGEAIGFVCLSTEEGIVRTVLEAMMRGCIICSYAHGPVAEYLPPPCQFEAGDLVAAARFLEELVARDRGGREYWDELSRLCYAHALRYGEQAERDSIFHAWTFMLSHADRASQPVTL